VSAIAALCGPAAANDTLPCTTGMICASKPETVTDLIKKLEPKAVITKGEDGTPLISIAGEYYDYFIYFKDCEKGAECAALGFSADFTKDALIDLAFVNKWNRNSRIAKAYIADDGAMYLTFDLSTVGGLNKANFSDVKTWWESQLKYFADFYDKESEARSAPKKKS
jgi:hypothetical protein